MKNQDYWPQSHYNTFFSNAFSIFFYFSHNKDIENQQGFVQNTTVINSSPKKVSLQE